MSTPKLTRRLAAVELADGRILTVRITNPDTMRYEQTAHRNGWPGVTVTDGVGELKDQTRKVTFETWAALKRTGQYEGTWEKFSQTDCLDVTVEEETVDPTQPAPAPTSSPSSHGGDADHSPRSLVSTTKS